MSVRSMGSLAYAIKLVLLLALFVYFYKGDVLDLAGKINQDFAAIRYVAYSPTHWAPGRQASELDIRGDLQTLCRTWDGLITYGSKDALREIPAIAKEVGFKRMILGVYDVTEPEDFGNAVALIEEFPDLIHSVCLGNEGLAFELYTLEQLIQSIRDMRRRFPHLWLTTSEPVFAFGEKTIVSEVDYCFPIIHPWIHDIFKNDPTTAALWTIQTAQRLQILSEKVILIKETGFPADGNLYPNDLQAQFWEVLFREIGAFTQNVHLAVFEAFDIPDKVNFAAFKDWDSFWGMYDKNRKPKPVLQVLERHFGGDGNHVAVESVPEPDGVSVVIATKDRPEFLKYSIESVLSQGDLVNRLILVNDNSQMQEVEDICLAYAASPQVKYVRLTGQGSSGSSRNAGLQHVDTKYVCFLDDDDAFLPGKIRQQLAVMRGDPEISFVATSAMVIDEDRRLCGRSGNPDFFPGAPLGSMLAFCRIVHSSVMMRTEVIRRYEGYLEHFKGEDWELWCRLLRGGEKLHFMDAPLTIYRRHTSNISTPTYLREAVENVLSRHLDLPSSALISPLPYAAASAELLKATLLILHGMYPQALEYLDELDLPTAQIARFMCLRELGEYEKASAEIALWSEQLGFSGQLHRRLEVHESRLNTKRRSIVGSPALLFEQRLLAHDTLATATLGKTYHPELERYFHQNPKNTNIEFENETPDDEIFFTRVSITSS